MKILVIDSQGGGIGKQLVGLIKEKLPTVEITAVGTNAIATSVMLKAGADYASTGENAMIVNASNADVIIGPIGIVIADSLLGEITSNIAKAVAQSKAKRILIPINQCNNIVVGVSNRSVGHLIQDAVLELKKLT